MTNAFATLTLRSTISHEILDRIRAENDISLAFPTQSLYFEQDIPGPDQISEKMTDKKYGVKKVERKNET